jgi:hypothetical protein
MECHGIRLKMGARDQTMRPMRCEQTATGNTSFLLSSKQHLNRQVTLGSMGSLLLIIENNYQIQASSNVKNFDRI